MKDFKMENYMNSLSFRLLSLLSLFFPTVAFAKEAHPLIVVFSIIIGPILVWVGLFYLIWFLWAKIVKKHRARKVIDYSNDD